MTHYIAYVCVTIAMTLLPSVRVQAQFHAHQHGHVTLDLAVEPRSITVVLNAPMDDLLGFERAARNDAERHQVTVMLEKLRAANRMLAVEGAAKCHVTDVKVVSAMLGIGVPARSGRDGHEDLSATYEFTCEDASRATGLTVSLFDAFSRIKRIDAQIVSARGQSKRTLRASARRIDLMQ